MGNSEQGWQDVESCTPKQLCQRRQDGYGGLCRRCAWMCLAFGGDKAVNCKGKRCVPRQIRARRKLAEQNDGDDRGGRGVTRTKRAIDWTVGLHKELRQSHYPSYAWLRHCL